MGVWSWYCYDLFALMASFMGEEEVAAAAVMRIMAMSMVMIPGGFSSACGIQVAAAVGSGQARAAMQYYSVNVIAGILSSAVTLALVHYNQETVYRWFTDQDTVVERV